MSVYTIITDSACDIAPAILADWGVKFVSLTYHFEGSDKEYTDQDMPAPEFYQHMRKDKVARTSAANVETFKSLIEE